MTTHQRTNSVHLRNAQDENLPHGMHRVGYDADSQTYTYQDADGSLWESEPAMEYGRLRSVAAGPSASLGETYVRSSKLHR